MAFGRKRGAEPPSFEPVHWDSVGQFTVGTALRPPSLRGKAAPGPHAIRVQKSRGNDIYLVPAVYVVPVEGSTGSVSAAKSGFRLYEDESAQRLLCSVTPDPSTQKDNSRRYRVRDGQASDIGCVLRAPSAKRVVQHLWWLEQPGHPEIVARYHWATGSPGEIVGRGAGKAIGSVVGSVLSLGADDSSNGPSKPVTWKAADQVALTSAPVGDVRWYLAQASWLDRRLAFSLAVLREA